MGLKSLEYARFSEKNVNEWKQTLEGHHSDKTLFNLTKILKEFVAEAEKRSCKRICLFTEHGAVLLKRKGTGAHMYYSPDSSGKSAKLAVHSAITEDLTAELLRCLYEQNAISNIVGPHSNGGGAEEVNNGPLPDDEELPPPYMSETDSGGTSRRASVLGEDMDLSLPEVPDFPLDPDTTVPVPEDATFHGPESTVNPEEVMCFNLTPLDSRIKMQEAVEYQLPFPPRFPVETQSAPLRRTSFPITSVSPHPNTLAIDYGEAANESQMVPSDSSTPTSPETSLPLFLKGRFASVQTDPTNEEIQELREELKLVIQGDKRLTLQREIEKLSDLKNSINDTQYLLHHRQKMHRLIENQSNLRTSIIALLNEDEVDETRHIILMKQILKIGIKNYRDMKNIKNEINKIADENDMEIKSKNFIVRDENAFPMVKATAKVFDDRSLKLIKDVEKNRLSPPKKLS
ncbi:hypothetical protein D9O50_04600 [Oxalobacteraceae bacterium CAVE-383]|nr:hypothetical protein D9O50_04600 [Oxalobacteraceae bacterium CAVE-383]